MERRRNENGGSLRVERGSQGEAKESNTETGRGSVTCSRRKGEEYALKK